MRIGFAMTFHKNRIVQTLFGLRSVFGLSRSLLHNLLVSTNLVHRELMRTYKKSRIGFGVILFPAIAGSFFAIGISSAQSGGTDLMQLYQVLFWLFLIDVGSYPLRLYKRVRPLIVLLDPSILSLAVSSTIRSIFLASLRMIPLFILNTTSGSGYHLPIEPLSSLYKSCLTSLVICLSIVASVAFLFSVGLLTTAFYLSFMEINQFLPPSLGLLGYISGYFPISRPAFLSGLDIYNPLALIREGLFAPSSTRFESLPQLFSSAMVLFTLSLLFSLLGNRLVNRLMRVR